MKNNTTKKYLIYSFVVVVLMLAASFAYNYFSTHLSYDAKRLEEINNEILLQKETKAKKQFNIFLNDFSERKDNLTAMCSKDLVPREYIDECAALHQKTFSDYFYSQMESIEDEQMKELLTSQYFEYLYTIDSNDKQQ